MRGLTPIDALQLNHTYLVPRPGTTHPGSGHRFGVLSEEQRDHAAEHGMEVWAYGPLLTGVYDNPDKPMPEALAHAGTDRRLAALDEVAEETGASRSQLVFAWLVAHGVRPMIGGSKLHQLDTAFDGATMSLTPEQLARLDNAA